MRDPDTIAQLRRLQAELRAVLGHVKDLRIENEQLKMALRKALQDDRTITSRLTAGSLPVGR